MNITCPGTGPAQRERHAVTCLGEILPQAEADGLVTAWWFIRKEGCWRIRYQLPQAAGTSGYPDPVQRLLAERTAWTGDIYEPEVHAFGGPGSMQAAHTLFHSDSRHLLRYLAGQPADRRELSLVLCTALLRAAGLDWNEQGDVWARIAAQRAGTPGQAPGPDPQTWTGFTSGIRHLLAGAPRADPACRSWLGAFAQAGAALRTLRQHGELTRGIRAVAALHVIFHWNRIGIPGSTQATIARGAQESSLRGVTARQRAGVPGPRTAGCTDALCVASTPGTRPRACGDSRSAEGTWVGGARKARRAVPARSA